MEMIDDAARNTHLGKRATALLKYYAGCGNGFRPALVEIQKHTGIASKKISEIRKELVDRAMISYKSQKGITIDWDTIQTLAGLPEPLKMRGKKYSFNPEGSYSEWPMLDRRVKDVMNLYTVCTCGTPEAELSPEAADFIHGVEKMTLREYHEFIHEFWGIKVVKENPETENIPLDYWHPDIAPLEDDNEEFEGSAPLPF
ncbi:MAG: hypothetical protein IKE24_12980 [Clostridia bacterium]|nr:hypothetical protein [Clostridia bacterium]